jgi:hypothetical protein
MFGSCFALTLSQRWIYIIEKDLKAQRVVWLLAEGCLRFVTLPLATLLAPPFPKVDKVDKGVFCDCTLVS